MFTKSALMAIVFSITIALTNSYITISGEATTTAADPLVFDLDISTELQNSPGNNCNEKALGFALEHCSGSTPICFTYICQ